MNQRDRKSRLNGRRQPEGNLADLTNRPQARNASTDLGPDFSDDELVIAECASSAIERAMDKLVPDDVLAQRLQQVKLDAISRTIAAEQDSCRGNIRSAALPILWSTSSGIASTDGSEPNQRVQFLLVYEPDGAQRGSYAPNSHRSTSRQLPRKLIAAFGIGGIVGALAPLALILTQAQDGQLHVPWRLSLFLILFSVATYLLVWLLIRALRATDSVEVKLSSGGSHVAVTKIRQRIGRSTLLFPNGSPWRPRGEVGDGGDLGRSPVGADIAHS